MHDIPKVSLLIPAYRQDYFEETLACAVNQDWPNLEIVVSDDSPGERIGQFVESAQTRRKIRYFRNKPPQGGGKNYLYLFEQATGDFVHYLNDDDLIRPDAIRRMALALWSTPSASVVAHHRVPVNEHGTATPLWTTYAPFVGDDAVIDGRSVMRLTNEVRAWLVGEPSFYMFRRREIEDTTPHVMSFAGASQETHLDVEQVCELLTKGDLLYLAAPLGAMRSHPGQSIHEDWYDYAINVAWKETYDKLIAAGLHTPGQSIRPRNVRFLGEHRPWWTERERSLYRQRRWVELADLCPLEPRIQYYAANDLLAAGRIKEAIAYATRLGEWYLEGRMVLARALHQIGRPQEGREILAELMNTARMYLPSHPAQVGDLYRCTRRTVLWMPPEPCIVEGSIEVTREKRREPLKVSVQMNDDPPADVWLPPGVGGLNFTLRPPVGEPFCEVVVRVSDTLSPPMAAEELHVKLLTLPAVYGLRS